MQRRRYALFLQLHANRLHGGLVLQFSVHGYVLAILEVLAWPLLKRGSAGRPHHEPAQGERQRRTRSMDVIDLAADIDRLRRRRCRRRRGGRGWGRRRSWTRRGTRTW